MICMTDYLLSRLVFALGGVRDGEFSVLWFSAVPKMEIGSDTIHVWRCQDII